jgi:hypothetical protein
MLDSTIIGKSIAKKFLVIDPPRTQHENARDAITKSQLGLNAKQKRVTCSR